MTAHRNNYLSFTFLQFLCDVIKFPTFSNFNSARMEPINLAYLNSHTVICLALGRLVNC